MNPECVLVKDKDGDRWKIELRNFGAFRDVLGADVMNAFCRCFVHADRLTSMISFAYLSQEHHGRDSRGFERNLQTMVWFTIGTLRELALAIRDLRSALKQRGILDPDSPQWVTLRDVEKRWEDDPFYRKMRNIAAFHVDPDVIGKGLGVIAKDEPVAVLCAGDGRKADQTFLTLGIQALFNGLDKNLDEIGKFMQVVGEDHGVGSAVQEAFLLAVEKAGLPSYAE